MSTYVLPGQIRSVTKAEPPADDPVDPVERTLFDLAVEQYIAIHRQSNLHATSPSFVAGMRAILNLTMGRITDMRADANPTLDREETAEAVYEQVQETAYAALGA